MRPPTLTIGLQTFNRAGSGYLQEALEAILAQTYRNFELLVLDNHSSDDTARLVMRYEDPRLTYIRQPPGRNPDTNFHSAIWMGRGQYILATHDDDVMESNLLESMVEFLMRHPGLAALATNVSLIDHCGSPIQQRLYDLEHDLIFAKDDYTATYLDRKLWFPTPTCLLHRDKTIAIKGPLARAFTHAYQPSADILTLCLLNVRDPIAILAEPLLRYRQHPGQESRNVDQSAPLIEAVRGLLKHPRRMKRHLPALHAALARYESQALLFKEGQQPLSPRLRRRVAGLRNRWEKAVSAADRCQDAALPFELLANLLELPPSIPTEMLQAMAPEASTLGTRGAYRQWANLAREGRGLLAGESKIRRVAILGSMFTAFLLVLEARKAGIEVLACLDSAPARQGQQVLGIPVVPHERLKEMGTLDAVILSSEREHEDALRRLLAPHLPDVSTPMPSWKDLANLAWGGRGVRP